MMPKVAEMDGITGKYYKHVNLLLTLNSSCTSCPQVKLNKVLKLNTHTPFLLWKDNCLWWSIFFDELHLLTDLYYQSASDTTSFQYPLIS